MVQLELNVEIEAECYGLVFHVVSTDAIKCTQFVPDFELKPKLLGPHQVSKVKPNDTYDKESMSWRRFKTFYFLRRIHAEYMKVWCPIHESDWEDEFEANSTQIGRVVGI